MSYQAARSKPRKFLIEAAGGVTQLSSFQVQYQSIPGSNQSDLWLCKLVG
jgi:hypothetical protein